MGERLAASWIGGIIDILTVIATIFGVANVVTVLFLISASTGLDKGIKIMSNTNLIIAVILMLFVWVTGPTSFMRTEFVT
ncbi:hypothetical protein BK133_21155 [Paenibacillus sp. FSL H8-0548]|nr:BCCT family transporter [Paenibacillus sp. FSL H8-0548]OMF25832.1 hypothetical protein BK133_21155 [Paenibacillus sp. FSL H8-0548]